MDEWSRKYPNLIWITIVIILHDLCIADGLCVHDVNGLSAEWSKVVRLLILIWFVSFLDGYQLPLFVGLVGSGCEHDFGAVVDFGISDLHDSVDFIGLRLNNDFKVVVRQWVNFEFLIGISSKFPQTGSVLFLRFVVQRTVHDKSRVHGATYRIQLMRV